MIIGITLFQCTIFFKPTNSHQIKRSIEEYKSITNYFIENNYHENFNTYLIYDPHKGNDSTINNFLLDKYVVGMYCRTDSTIEYRFFHTPLLGKIRVLVFDFSLNQLNREESKAKIIEENIYYYE